MTTNEQTLAAWEDVVQTVIASSLVQAFQQAEQKMVNHDKIHALQSQIKLERKALVNAKHYQKQAALDIHEQNIINLENELDAIPLWNQYRELQREINDLLQTIITDVEINL
ncbi:MAG: YlbF family regulator [Culicoidibacterales bacterium]